MEAKGPPFQLVEKPLFRRIRPRVGGGARGGGSPPRVGSNALNALLGKAFSERSEDPGCFVEADEGDRRAIRVLRQEAADRLDGDAGGLLQGVVVHPRADGGESHRSAPQLQGQGHRVLIAARQQLRLPVSAPVPHGAHRVNHILGGEPVALRGLGLPGLTAVEGAALGQQLRARRPVDGSVHPAAPQQRGVCGVDNGVNL